MKLDLGCGTRKKEGFIGVDSRRFDGVDVVCNLGSERWPWGDETVEEIHCSHMVEHLKPEERIHFANEMHRVLKRGAKALLVTPSWKSARAYGDLTHQWPPVSAWWYLYLNRAWRETNAPHNDLYTCDFDHVCGQAMHPSLSVRSQEFQVFALFHYLEAEQDLHATLTKR